MKMCKAFHSPVNLTFVFPIWHERHSLSMLYVSCKYHFDVSFDTKVIERKRMEIANFQSFYCPLTLTMIIKLTHPFPYCIIISGKYNCNREETGRNA